MEFFLVSPLSFCVIPDILLLDDVCINHHCKSIFINTDFQQLSVPFEVPSPSSSEVTSSTSPSESATGARVRLAMPSTEGRVLLAWASSVRNIHQTCDVCLCSMVYQVPAQVEKFLTAFAFFPLGLNLLRAFFLNACRCLQCIPNTPGAVHNTGKACGFNFPSWFWSVGFLLECYPWIHIPHPTPDLT